MYRVLVADDEPIERTVVNKTIQKYFKGQLEVVEAVNGREAVQLFFEKECQIALLDIEMPGINGLEAAERIRENDKECSIVFLTAFDEFGYAKRAICVHALDYLLKPGADEELIAVLEEAIQVAKENEQRTEENGAQRNTESERNIAQEENENWEQSTENVRMTAVAEGIREYIDTHYMEDISLQTAAGAMNYSEAYFCKLFKQCFNKNFTAYLTEYRVKEAKRMLEQPAMNVKDVGRAVGYMDSNYFTRVFKRITGQTPTEYRGVNGR